MDPHADQRTLTAIERASDRVAFEGLQALAAGLSAGFAIFGVINSQKLGADLALAVTGFNLSLAAAFLLLWLALRRKLIPRHYASATITASLLLALANVLFTFAWVGEPLQNNIVALLVIAAGSFLLSRRWLAVTLISMLAAWAPVAWWVSRGGPPLLQFAMTLLGAVVLTLTIHTARLRTHQRLRRSELRYRRLFEQSHDAVAVTTPEGRLIDINPAGLELFGYTPEKIPDFHVARDAYADPERRDSRIQKIQDGGFLRDEMTLKHRSGRLLSIESTTSAIQDKDGRIIAFLSVLRDVTTRRQEQNELADYRERLEELVRERTAQLETETHQRHQTEAQRRNLEAQFHEAQKLESLGLLASGIAHDFNNLLVSILGNASLVRRNLPADAPDQEPLERIEVAAERAAELAQQMLAYSGKGQFVFEPCDLRQVVQEMMSLLRTSISKKARLVLHCDGEPPTIRADVTQMRQVVMNLITNASDALQGDVGNITVRVGALTDAPDVAGQLPSAFDVPEEPVFLQVVDDGCGMDSATQSKLFDPFFTTKVEGRGLGMAAVLGIVRGHRAQIHVESAPGSGSTFTILFPASSGTRAAEELGESSRDIGWRGDGRKILVVDDEESVRYVAATCLESAGFEVAVGTDGRVAVELFQAQPDAFDLVLLDSRMPHLGGVEALHELRRIRPDIKVVLLSGDPEAQATAGAEGLDGFVAKPFRLPDLLGVIRRALETPATPSY
ncbi:MAG: response regulator [Acidobacteriota bacterium]